VGPWVSLAPAIVSLLWGEISSRWVHSFCPSPELPRDIHFTASFAIHQNEQTNHKKLLQTIERAVQKICGKDVQSVKPSLASPMNFKLLPEPASGIKFVSYQCSVHGTEESVEQAVRDEVINTGKSLREEKNHQNCDLTVQRGLYECDPAISIKCILGNRFGDLNNYNKYEHAEGYRDNPFRYLKLTRSEFSYPDCSNFRSNDKGDIIHCYNERGEFRFGEPRVVTDIKSRSELAKKCATRTLDGAWVLVAPIIEKVKSVVYSKEMQEHKVQQCLIKKNEEHYKTDIFDMEQAREKRECAQIIEDWFKKMKGERRTVALENDVIALSSPALELIKKHLPKGKEPVAGDLYSFFGLEKGATLDEIKTAYRKITLSIHPDKQPKENSKIAEEAFLFIRNAYEHLQKELQGS